jgi:hypothetical protein
MIHRNIQQGQRIEAYVEVAPANTMTKLSRATKNDKRALFRDVGFALL